MTESATLVERVSFRDSDHSYHLDGRRVPSVTTILGNLSKPALPSWAARVGAEAARDLLLGLPRVIVDGGLPVPHANIETLAAEIYDAARTAHHRVKTAAADKGSIVHDAIQQYHEDFFTAQPPAELDYAGNVTPAYRAWEAFTAWWADADLTCIATERKIVASDGSYAGRLDMLCEGNELLEVGQDPDGGILYADSLPLYVCDIKTSNGVYPEHVYQNAAYAQAISDELGRPVAGTKIIWLPAGCTKATIIEREGVEWQHDFEVFAACLRIHAHRRGLSKWLMDIKTEHGPIPF